MELLPTLVGCPCNFKLESARVKPTYLVGSYRVYAWVEDPYTRVTHAMTGLSNCTINQINKTSTFEFSIKWVFSFFYALKTFIFFCWIPLHDLICYFLEYCDLILSYIYRQNSHIAFITISLHPSDIIMYIHFLISF